MANEQNKDFNAMLHDSKDMPKIQVITDQKSIEKYGGDRMYFAPPIAYDAGIPINDVDPDYVVFGEPDSYHYDQIVKAIRLVENGARLIGTNSDLTGPSESGSLPSCRALIAPIELATNKKAYFVGKPNPLMMRTGLRLLGAHSEDTVMIGDRMDTDMVAGIETGLDTVLVLSGVTSKEDIERFPYRPRLVLNGVGEIPG